MKNSVVKKISAVALALAASLPVCALPSQTRFLAAGQPQAAMAHPTEAKPPAFDALRAAGFEALYNIDYKTAQVKFEELVKAAPEHPAGYLYVATNQWLSILNSMRRLQIGLYTRDSFYANNEDKVDPQLDQQFRAAIQKTIEVAQARLAKNAKDAEALYYLGAAYGALGGYEASVSRKFRPAMSNGSKGVDYHRQVVKLDPNYADAYLSIGLYDYIVGTLPWPVKLLLAVGGVRGSRKRGLEELQLAVAKAKYVNDDARTMLIALYTREGKHDEALKLLEELTAKYPQNYLYALERAATLGRTGRHAESYATFDQLLKNERAQAVTDLIRYQYGEALLGGGESQRAAEQFAAAAKTPKANANLVTLAHLRHGQALDLAGKRQAAVVQYQAVLKRENVFDSHDQARKYLKKAYSPEKAAPTENQAENKTKDSDE